MGKGGAPGDLRSHQGGGVGESGSVPRGPYPSSAAVKPVSLESPGLGAGTGRRAGPGWTLLSTLQIRVQISSLPALTGDPGQKVSPRALNCCTQLWCTPGGYSQNFL